MMRRVHSLSAPRMTAPVLASVGDRRRFRSPRRTGSTPRGSSTGSEQSNPTKHGTFCGNASPKPPRSTLRMHTAPAGMATYLRSGWVREARALALIPAQRRCDWAVSMPRRRLQRGLQICLIELIDREKVLQLKHLWFSNPALCARCLPACASGCEAAPMPGNATLSGARVAPEQFCVGRHLFNLARRQP